MSGKTVLITGANKGIGYETARQLGHLGFRIWLGCRDTERGLAAVDRLVAEGLDVRLLTIDVTNDTSVQEAAGRVLEEDGALDILINNAGISGNLGDAPSVEPINDVRSIYETNVFGPMRVTQAFLPLLKSAGAASIVMVSSGLGSLTWLSDPANRFYDVNLMGYNSSKSALNAVTVSFAKEFIADGIRINSAEPGYTATDFTGHAGYRTATQAAAGIVWLATQPEDGPTGRFFFEQEEVPW